MENERPYDAEPVGNRGNSEQLFFVYRQQMYLMSSKYADIVPADTTRFVIDVWGLAIIFINTQHPSTVRS